MSTKQKGKNRRYIIQGDIIQGARCYPYQAFIFSTLGRRHIVPITKPFEMR